MNEELKKMLIEQAGRLHENAGTGKERLPAISFYQEKLAALLVSQIPDFEPSRSILFKSAASLAIDLGRFEEARTLLRIGLDGATGQMAGELREIGMEIYGK